MSLPASQAAGRLCGSFKLWIPRPFRPEGPKARNKRNDQSSYSFIIPTRITTACGSHRAKDKKNATLQAQTRPRRVWAVPSGCPWFAARSARGRVGPGRIDVHISGDPAALLLYIYGRESQWKLIATGQLAAWGRKPWLAFTFRSRFHTPDRIPLSSTRETSISPRSPNARLQLRSAATGRSCARRAVHAVRIQERVFPARIISRA